MFCASRRPPTVRSKRRLFRGNSAGRPTSTSSADFPTEHSNSRQVTKCQLSAENSCFVGEMNIFFGIRQNEMEIAFFLRKQNLSLSPLIKINWYISIFCFPPNLALFRPIWQVTRKKIELNPFAKGFRDQKGDEEEEENGDKKQLFNYFKNLVTKKFSFLAEIGTADEWKRKSKGTADKSDEKSAERK